MASFAQNVWTSGCLGCGGGSGNAIPGGWFLEFIHRHVTCVVTEWIRSGCDGDAYHGGKRHPLDGQSVRDLLVRNVDGDDVEEQQPRHVEDYSFGASPAVDGNQFRFRDD